MYCFYTPAQWVMPYLQWAASEKMCHLPSRLREWARALNAMWRSLGRRAAPSAHAAPARTSLLPRRHGVVVPGGRFRESYYWDRQRVVVVVASSSSSSSSSPDRLELFFLLFDGDRGR